LINGNFIDEFSTRTYAELILKRHKKGKKKRMETYKIVEVEG